MATFFLSYSRKDSVYAESLRKHIELMDSAHDVFMDVFSIDPGDNWKNKLASNIDFRDYFILLLSKNALESKWVRNEIQIVRNSELETGLRKLFILRIDDVPIPSYLNEHQIQTVTGNFIIDFYKLMTSIHIGKSYFQVDENAATDFENGGYNIALWIDCPKDFKKLIELVEYRFDFGFVESIAGVEGTESSDDRKNDFPIYYWTSEANTVFITIYLKNTKEIHFVHKVSIG